MALVAYAPNASYGLYPHIGAVAQLVEQRPEEPCVTGSSPVGATIQNEPSVHFLLRQYLYYTIPFVIKLFQKFFHEPMSMLRHLSSRFCIHQIFKF